MNELLILILLATTLGGVLLWLLIPGHKSSATGGPALPSNVNDVLSVAKHYAYFPQVRRALSGDDARYLRENASPQVAKQALRERRAVARGFLKGLHEDFSNLARLGRIAAALSPEVSREQETERLVLTLKFQLMYSLTWLRLSTGNMPLEQLEHMTGLVEKLATRMDAAMAEISAVSASQLRGGLGA
jgi:hypothetical protein